MVHSLDPQEATATNTSMRLLKDVISRLAEKGRNAACNGCHNSNATDVMFANQLSHSTNKAERLFHFTPAEYKD